MKFLYGLGGANIPVIREFDIEKDMCIHEGQIVRCTSEGKINSGVAGSCIGVAAETHTGEKDILNARNNGTKIRVDVTMGGVYAICAPKLEASENGSETKLVCADGDVCNADLYGGKLVLIRKGEGSENTDEIGSERGIYAVEVMGGGYEFEITSGAKVCKGDVYMLVPAIGYKGYIDGDNRAFVTKSDSGIALTVVGADKKNMTLEVVVGNKVFEK